MLVLLSVTATGCDGRIDPHPPCALSSQCAAPLVCRAGLCRAECFDARDCPPGLDCLRDQGGIGACQVDRDLGCRSDDACPDPLVCRLGECANQCEEDRDCASGSRCVDEGAGRACIDVSVRECARNSDCGITEVCAGDGRCREECVEDRDCPRGFSCGGGGCGPPAAVAGVSAGGDHTCARRFDGTARCWGSNELGQLGTGTTDPVAGVVDPGISRVVVVDTGERAGDASPSHSCAVHADGRLTCWGADRAGIGGVGPGEVGGKTGVRSVALGRDHGCALFQSGRISCWGDNWAGQRGVSGDATPLEVIDDAFAVAAGGAHNCAIRANGEVWCWGFDNSDALGRRPGGATPDAVPDLRGAIDVATGEGHTCAALADGRALCWGLNDSGQTGYDDRGRAVRAVPDVQGAVQVACGNMHSCALSFDGRVWCWGEGSAGQLGAGVTAGGRGPELVPGLDDAVQIDAGTLHTCALRRDGSVWCWGWNGDGRVSPSARRGIVAAPVRVEGVEGP